MRNIMVSTMDDKAMYIIPENTILEVGENSDGTATLAFFSVITVKSTLEEIRKDMTKEQSERVRWLKLPQTS